jgi:hypothetical protein
MKMQPRPTASFGCTNGAVRCGCAEHERATAMRSMTFAILGGCRGANVGRYGTRLRASPTVEARELVRT